MPPGHPPPGHPPPGHPPPGHPSPGHFVQIPAITKHSILCPKRVKMNIL